ncbi:hypothetical protein ACO0K3_09660 [Undibacterium sp. Rencai35W]|uniref:hypothetical protein n=1 Tax=Undibacterium sp. Rencai35W TaxID=3413046 RepID=UPI003BF20F27
MKKLFVIMGALLIAATCLAADKISGAYGHSYRIKDHPLGNIPFGSSIKIKKQSEDSAFVQITLNEATAGSSCGGGLSGVGKLIKDKITLTKTEDKETCVVSITVSNNAAHVTQELNCTGFHGAGCSFDEAASNLPKINRRTRNRKTQQ